MLPRYIEVRHIPKRAAWKAVVLRDCRQISVYAESPGRAFETLADLLDLPPNRWHAVSKSSSRMLFQELHPPN